MDELQRAGRSNRSYPGKRKSMPQKAAKEWRYNNEKDNKDNKKQRIKPKVLGAGMEEKMKNATITKMIEKLTQAEEFPETAKANMAYVKECLLYEKGVNENMAQHVLKIKKLNKGLKK